MKNKSGFPFRLGTSSYIIPDDMVPNARFLANKVDDIELLFLELDYYPDSPNDASILELNDIAQENNLSYSIHLPADASFGDHNEETRKKTVANCLKAFSITKQLNPFAYVIHFHGNNNDDKANPPSDDMHRWKAAIERSITEILDTGIPAEMICVETLFYPISLIDDILTKFNLSVCLDIGHIMLSGGSVEEHLDKYLSRTKVIHLHGIENGKDHRDISFLAPEMLSLILSRIKTEKTYERVLTLEVFNQERFEKSMQVMERQR